MPDSESPSIPPAPKLSERQAWWQTLRDWKPFLSAVYAIATIAYPIWLKYATKPVIEQVLHIDSESHFGNAIGGEKFTIVRYDLKNPGPGRLDDTKLLFRIKHSNRSYVKVSPANGGHVRELKNVGAQGVASWILSSSEDSSAPSPINPHHKFGLEIVITSVANPSDSKHPPPVPIAYCIQVIQNWASS